MHRVDNLTNFVTNVNMKKKNCKNCNFFGERFTKLLKSQNWKRKKKEKKDYNHDKKLNSFSHFFLNNIQMYLGMENIKLTAQVIWIHRCLVSIR